MTHKKNLKKSIIRHFAVLLTVVLSLLFFNFAFAATSDTLGINYGAGTGLSNESPFLIIARVVRIALGFVGIITVALIIYGGFLWMNSGGSPEKVNQAKTLLKNLSIGLIIIASAFSIASFIISALTGEGVFSNILSTTGRGNSKVGGMGALGDGVIQSVYPEPNQKDVSRNTSIVITFREEMNPNTICKNPVAGFCDGSTENQDGIRIFEATDTNCATGGSCATDIKAKVVSTDNKVFTFIPTKYLGSANAAIWQAVYLNSGISKASGDPAFGAGGYFEWQFEVSNKLDLTPPQVSSIFPPADNIVDTASTVLANAASGHIQLTAQPKTHIVTPPTIEPTTPVSHAATINGNYTCQTNGVINLAVSMDNKIVVSSTINEIPNISIPINFVSKTVDLSCGLILSFATTTSGDSWRVNVTAEQVADTLTVGDITYTFVSTNPDNSGTQIQVGSGANGLNQTMNNIKTALNRAASPVIASLSGNNINLVAKLAGANGNFIALGSSAASIGITPMSGGSDQVDSYTEYGQKDQPRNSIIQINFNEAVSPLTASGKASDVSAYLRVENASTSSKLDQEACTNNSDCKSYKCDTTSHRCSGSYVSGSFVLSNQYKTLEFISDNECGTNACGGKVYCLPEESNLRVWIRAADLFNCANDTSNNDNCKGKDPYIYCVGGGANKICKNSNDTTGINHPLSQTPLTGVADLALNSLDGNATSSAQGPISDYNLNATSTSGDNFTWSFFINKKLDLTTPTIRSTSVDNGANNVNLFNNIAISFDKLMMASSLVTGSTVVNNGKADITHQLINLWNYANRPVGYWVTSEGVEVGAHPDGLPDMTTAHLNHTDFSGATVYRAQVGSGVKDIYQNCYKPCSGPVCNDANPATPTTNSNPSCCAGALNPVASSTCPLL